ncbi:MAG: GyrI-like domain-containing protein [Planctomycetes bacterium]|nr:GyrI-like domain-containing protein [Planctomycetota bacterium]
MPADRLPAATELLAAAARKLGGAPHVRVQCEGTVVALWRTSRQSLPFARGTFVQLVSPAGRLLRIELPGSGTFEWGNDGKDAWHRGPIEGSSFRRGRADRVDSLLTGFVCGTVAWKGAYSDMKTVRRRRVDGHDAFELRMRHGESEPDLWWVDANSGLPSGCALHTTNGLGSDTVWTVMLADWQPFEGRLLPRSCTLREGHLELRLKVAAVAKGAVAADKRIRMDADARVEAKQRAANAAAKGTAGVTPPVIRIAELRERHALTVRVKVKPAEISLTFARILPQVMGYLAKKGVTPDGAPFSLYHSFGKEVELEAGFPVPKRVEGEGVIKAVVLPAGKAAVTWHVGPYHDLATSHGRLQAWIAAQGLEALGPLREIYWTDPGLEQDPKRWRTEIIRPVRKKN